MSFQSKAFRQSKFDKKQHRNDIRKKTKYAENEPKLISIDDNENIPSEIIIIGSKVYEGTLEDSNKVINLPEYRFKTPYFDNAYKFPNSYGIVFGYKSKWYSRHHKKLNKKYSNKERKNTRSGNNYSKNYLRTYISNEIESY
jgi:hypothetical protein